MIKSSLLFNNIATAINAMLHDGDNLFEAALDNTRQSNCPVVQIIQLAQEENCVHYFFNIQ